MSTQPHNPALIPPGAITPSPIEAPVQRPQNSPLNGPSFQEVLAGKTAGVEFSGHALQRIQRRGIDVSEGTMQRLSDGVARAAGKGARESVVFVDGTAFVVSVRNRTVITAVGREHMREHVFTNIDSAVIA